MTRQILLRFSIIMTGKRRASEVRGRENARNNGSAITSWLDTLLNVQRSTKMFDSELYENECEHANHDGSEPDQPESRYHDGRGIQVSVSFNPLPPRSSNGEKRCKNAKITSINWIMYFHEDSSLAQLLNTAIETLDQVNNLQYALVP
ncbi:hypothetical protein BS17DRAFT_321272 [Gyrodon lividus]|nr:hypothetical protein BS17DRAFT_321272 [Gyrodon lividus]